MSLYSQLPLGNVTLPSGGTAVVTGAQMSVRVEEDEMLLHLNFQGNILGVTAAVLTMGFEVDGVAATALPLLGHTFLTGQLQLPVNFTLPVTLTKGEHVVALTANTTTAAAATDGTAFDCRFSATRVSNAAALAHGVDSKVQGIF
jgi:hypothetical protein